MTIQRLLITRIFKGVLKRSAQMGEWPALSTRTCLPSILEARCFDDGDDEYDLVDDIFDDVVDDDGDDGDDVFDDDGDDVFDDVFDDVVDDGGGDDHELVCQVSWT